MWGGEKVTLPMDTDAPEHEDASCRAVIMDESLLDEGDEEASQAYPAGTASVSGLIGYPSTARKQVMKSANKGKISDNGSRSHINTTMVNESGEESLDTNPNNTFQETGRTRSCRDTGLMPTLDYLNVLPMSGAEGGYSMSEGTATNTIIVQGTSSVGSRSTAGLENNDMCPSFTLSAAEWGWRLERNPLGGIRESAIWTICQNRACPLLLEDPVPQGNMG